MHSPNVEKVEVVSEGQVRRARLYYLRGLAGKAARLREREQTRPDERQAQVQATPAEPPVAAPGSEA